jgi:chaperone modulatory protein CbpM
VDVEFSQAMYLDDTGALSVDQLIEQSGLTETEIAALVECGALVPRSLAAASWSFSSQCIVVARTAHRLREDFALDDAHALAIVLRLEQRIQALEAELREVRARRGR